MTIEFSCQQCKKVLKTSDDKAGCRAKCPQCGETIDVPLSEVVASDDGFDGFDKADRESPLSEEESFLANSPVREEASFLAQGNIDCPMCGASIPARDTSCQACGETLQASGKSRHWEHRIIKVGEVLTRSWKLFKTNLGAVIGVHFVAYLLSMIAGFAFLMIVTIVGFGGGAMLIQPDPTVLIILGIIFYIVLILFSMVIQYYFMLGVQSFLLKLVRGEHPTFGELFSGGPYLGRMLLCSLVFMLLGTACYLLFVIPGLIFLLVFWPYSFLLIDQNLPGIRAFSESRKITKGNLLSMFLISLVMMGVFLVPYLSMVAMSVGMDQGGGQGFPVILGLMMFCFFATVYLLLIPFFMLVGTVSYAEMTNQ
ncbi:DUF975 family protein [uncultured Gimesia sp.]|uniref:DUF975 family protein n=1 Tax=uncultured Gimesia sp. TaxID=1678688 RepID=UPI002623A461|nr:DUF975 family protein [uncultured Gimesia sp.]